ncbi:MAG: UDP-N-acetylglucosamine-2-epimerase [Deltaproteobacteria bacterium]|nr:UDP-N-acetylglucosamine-2-epimerase [Deltaproteobacteria bacterium]
MRKIAVVTGARADYGLLYWIIKDIHDDPDLKLQLIVTGMHLSPEFGLTANVIENDGFPIAEKVDMLLSSNTAESVAVSMGLGMIGFAKVFKRLRPDIIVVLGDRFEIFSAVSAAIPLNIPVAHIHGGEGTEGTMDELYRHAITKMSHLHFTSAAEYRKRVIQMGERPSTVFCFGAPGLDSITRLPLLPKRNLTRELGIPEDMKIGVMTYHPSTLEKISLKEQTEEILSALKSFPTIFWVLTYPNADMGGKKIIEAMKRFERNNVHKARIFVSLGQIRYLSLLKHADLMVGNSSSGMIEAPAFKLPVVNIGDRQRGRIKVKNVIDVPECQKNKIVRAIKKALSMEFKNSIVGLKNPYGQDGRASKKIINTLKRFNKKDVFIKKSFYNITFKEI